MVTKAIALMIGMLFGAILFFKAIGVFPRRKNK